MKATLKELGEGQGVRLGPWTAVILVLVTLLYFAGIFYLGSRGRYIFMAVAAAGTMFFVKPRPGSWVPVLPLLFVLGGSTIPIGDFNPAVSTLVLIAFTAFFVIDRFLWNRPLFVPSPYLSVLTAALVLQTVSVFTSIHVHEQYALNAIRDGSSLFLFFPLALMIPVLCDSDEKLDRLLKAITLSLLVVSFIGVLQYFSITSFSRVDMSLGYVYRGRVASVFGNPNIFAGYLELTIPIALVLLIREKGLVWRLASFAAVALGILSVLYTFSRGGLICTFGGVGMTLLYLFRRRIWIPVLLGFLSIFLLMRNADTFQRQVSFFLNPEQNITQPTIIHRYVSYKGYLKQFYESPVTGIGYGSREFYWGRSRLYSFWEVRFARSTRSISRFGGLNSLVLNNAVKGGLVSVASVVVLFSGIYAAFFGIMRSKCRWKILAVAITAGIFSFMGHQIVDNQIRFPTVNSLFWLIVGMLLAISAMSRKESRDSAV